LEGDWYFGIDLSRDGKKGRLQPKGRKKVLVLDLTTGSPQFLRGPAYTLADHALRMHRRRGRLRRGSGAFLFRGGLTAARS
jgi:hypothetical protein